MLDRNRKIAMVAAGVAVLVTLMAVYFGLRRPTPTPPPGGGTTPPPATQRVTLTPVRLMDAPAEVADAAARLMHSRVGYAMPVGGRTYLIVSSGSDDLKMSLVGAVGQPGTGTPSFVDVNLATSSSGERLMILAAPIAGGAEYQFNLDGTYAAIPTLHNRHGLPLVTLPHVGGFVVISPASDETVSGRTFDVSGYARVFEAQFTLKAMSAKGRILAETQVMPAAGAPSWGSFVASLTLPEGEMPETGFLVLEDPMTEAKLVVPVRFRAPRQLG